MYVMEPGSVSDSVARVLLCVGGGGSRKWGWKKRRWCCFLRGRFLKGVGFEDLRTEPGTEGVTERLWKRYLAV